MKLCKCYSIFHIIMKWQKNQKCVISEKGGGGVGRKAFSFRCGREKFEGKRKKNKFAFLEGGKDGVVITLGRGNKIS